MRRAQAENFKTSLEATGLTIELAYDGPRGYVLYAHDPADNRCHIAHTVTAAQELLRKRKPGRTHANRDKAKARP